MTLAGISGMRHMAKNQVKGTKNNRINPYLSDETFERLDTIRWERRLGWGELLEWALPGMEAAHAKDRKAAKSKKTSKA